jgi:hypothetical protein
LNVKNMITLAIIVATGGLKEKFHPITGHEGPEEDCNYSTTLSLTSALDGGCMVSAMPRSFYPRERNPAPNL